MIKKIGIYFLSSHNLVDSKQYYINLSIIMGLILTLFVFLFDPYDIYSAPLKYSIPIGLIQIGYGINLTFVIYVLYWLIFLKFRQKNIKRPWKTYHHWLLLVLIELVSGFSGTVYHRLLIDVGEVDASYYMLVTVPRSIVIGCVLFAICILHDKLYEKNMRIALLQKSIDLPIPTPLIIETSQNKLVVLRSPIIKQTIKVRPHNITFLKAYGNYVEIHLKNEERALLLRSPLHFVAEQLSSHSYIKKCHRQYYVNIFEVGFIKKRILSIKNSIDSIPVSKKYNKEIISVLKNPII